MPVWPAASIAFIFAYYYGWIIAPGVILGTIASNYFSLGSSFIFACMISIMNTIGPIVAAKLMRKHEASADTSFKSRLFYFVVLSLIVAPILTASGGIGSKLLLGLISYEEMMAGWLKWMIAHLTGTLLIAVPFFVFKIIFEAIKGDIVE